MKCGIFYYSYSGNNRLLAERLGERLNTTPIPILETKRRTWLTIFLDVFFNRDSKIKTPDTSVLEYDLVLFIAPLWNSKIANPLKTFIKHSRKDLREYAFISFCGGYEVTGQNEKVSKELYELTGRTPRAVFELHISDLFPANQRKKISVISRYKAKTEDLSAFEAEIKRICEMGGFK
ncbi:MAG TPA: flavodoxin domain-containing protein [Pseudobdellovibrionaceae bacterium]|jgi:hypothetical protein